MGLCRSKGSTVNASFMCDVPTPYPKRDDLLNFHFKEPELAGSIKVSAMAQDAGGDHHPAFMIFSESIEAKHDMHTESST